MVLELVLRLPWPTITRPSNGAIAWRTGARLPPTLGASHRLLERPGAPSIGVRCSFQRRGQTSVSTSASTFEKPPSWPNKQRFWVEDWLRNKKLKAESKAKDSASSSTSSSAKASAKKMGRPPGTKNKPKVPKDGTAQCVDLSGTLEELSSSDGPQLSPEQAKVVELAASGRNIFYTGSAGCGKSTVLRAVVERLRRMGKRVEVMAPTGRAALAINGTTTWTFAGWSPNSHKVSIEKLKESATRKSSRVRSRFRKTDVIIIDEISMVENLHFERLNQVMKAARVKKHYAADRYPFGGVQVIVTGDFAQLPPVKPFQHCIECGSETQLDIMEEFHMCRRCKTTYNALDKWAFRSKAWQECEFAHVHLKTIHRQHDQDFVSLLQKCRMGEPFTAEEVDLLMNHESATTGAVELYSTREEVRAINEREFRRLATKPYAFKCHDTFIWNEVKHPHLAKRAERHADGCLKSLEEHSYDRLAELKSGMHVVLLVNLDLKKGLCNGSQGVIVGWKLPEKPGSGEALQPEDAEKPGGGLKQDQIAAFEKNCSPAMWPIVRFNNGVKRVIRADCQINELGDDEPYSLLCRTQIPLAPAWALSIHRAQGMTLDRVKVDLSKAFLEGQVYVALSRATSLQGLKVVGDAKGLAVGRGGNKEVRAFYKEKFDL